MSKLPIGFRCSTDRFKKSKQAQARVEEIDEKIRQVINNLRKSELGSKEHKDLTNTLNQLENAHREKTKEIAQLAEDRPQFFNAGVNLKKNKKNKRKSIQKVFAEQQQKSKLREWNSIQADARRRRDTALDNKKRSQLEKQKIIDNRKFVGELRKESQTLRQFSGMDISGDTMKRDGVDVFISHASEDKDSIVRDLADSLIKEGVSVWYDEYSLSIGDSLSSSINKGLSKCTFGIVVLSPDFVKKKWPEIELQSLYAKEVHKGKSILPIWHRITFDEVIEFNLHMADKFALNTSTHSVEMITKLIIKELDKKLIEA
ncbi:toll/interleukin-1 receptor domain-containing protein [Vibrio bivalvicida]|uniref:Toll/interleukin-1 receptor domain-containing protein n=1 Tax=Vibrio bivalvicida TaxID=1276888 RepID=A0ABV4MIE7_9VIBR